MASIAAVHIHLLYLSISLLDGKLLWLLPGTKASYNSAVFTKMIPLLEVFYRGTKSVPREFWFMPQR